MVPIIPTLFLVGAQARRSNAMSMGPDQCALTQIAFCDTFQTIVGGGREGDLDPAKWSYTRDNQQNNPYQGQIDNYAPVVAQFCKTTKVVQPDGDSFICGAQFNESNHWMDAMDDNGQYVLNSARIRQPFDFANRTGNIVFDVDAKTEGPHSFWNEVWITDQPVQGPHTDHPGTHSYPRNGVAFIFNADWCGGALQSANALRDIDTFTNYQETVNSIRSPCFTTQADNANHFQIKISQSHIEVWASDAGGANFRQISSSNIPLSLSRGYVSFQHAQYNAAKFNSTSTMTYHWHAIGFDGPVLPTDRGYEVGDALTPRASDGTVNLGYQVPTKTFQLPGVDLSNVAQAYLTYSTWFFAAPKTMTATINGVKTAPYTDPTDGIGDNGANGYTWRYMVQPVPLSMLQSGTNTLSLNTPCGTDQCPTVANIDLELVLNGNAPVDTTTTMPMSTTTMPMATTTTMPMSTTTMPVATTTVPPIPVPVPGSGIGVTLDRSVKGNYGPGAALVSPRISTSNTNELLVAYVSSDGPGQSSGQSITSVAGGGLTWTRAVASNSQAGDAEIWTAWSAYPLSNVKVTATPAVWGYEGSITVAAFTGASNVVGAVGSAGGSSGAPHVSLTAPAAGSWIWAVGHDWDAGAPRQVGSTQTLVNQYVDYAVGDTSWVERTNGVTAGNNTTVSLSDAAPTNDSWNLAAIAIQPM